MNDKEICRRIIGNRRAMLARQLAENSALSNLAHSALFHNNNNNNMGRSTLFHNSPLLSSILANALVQIMISKVDRGTQTLLRIPTKPDFYIRYLLPCLSLFFCLSFLSSVCPSLSVNLSLLYLLDILTSKQVLFTLFAGCNFVFPLIHQFLRLKR